ncbi:MAG: integrase/recombinase XerC [Alphaproteobacteria bacterium]|jgi:integrase/recombinase XerC
MQLLIIDSNINQEIQNWLIYLEKNLNYSDKTITAYAHNMRYFVQSMNQILDTSLTLSDIMALTLQNFRDYLDKRKNVDLITHRSLTRNLSAIKSFFAHQERYTGLRNEALAHLTISFKNRTLPKPIEQQDLFDILDYLKTHSHKSQWVRDRNYALGVLLYGCGVRISEALSLTVNDVSSNHTHLKIIGKGSKIRHVPYLQTIRDAIIAYLDLCPYDLNITECVFIGIKGKPLNSRVFYETLRQAHCYLDIPYQFSAHNFRHSCASHLLNDGANLRMIQSLMGHKKLSATENYLKINHAYLRQVIVNAHPHKKN